MIELKPFSKILIIRLSSLGDILHTLPSVELLRKNFPFAKIGWLIEEGFYDLIKHNPYIDRIYFLRFRSPVHKNQWRIFFNTIKKIRKEKYDVTIDFQGLIKSSILTFLSGSNYKVGFSENDLREKYAKFFYNATASQSFEGGHIILKNISLLSIVNIYNGDIHSPKLFIPEEDEYAIDEELKKIKLEKYYIVHCYAGWKTKQWGFKNYANVIMRFYKESNIKALITWAPNEYARARNFVKICNDAAILSFPTSISKLAALIKRALMIVGGDSGPIHMADALQKPIIALYGPTKPQRTGPINLNAKVIYHELGCNGCRKRNCPYNHINCMKSITQDEVFNAMMSVYKNAIN